MREGNITGQKGKTGKDREIEKETKQATLHRSGGGMGRMEYMENKENKEGKA